MLRQFTDEVEVVLDKENANAALCETAHLMAEHALLIDGETSSRFIEEDIFGLCSQRRGPPPRDAPVPSEVRSFAVSGTPIA